MTSSEVPRRGNAETAEFTESFDAEPLCGLRDTPKDERMLFGIHRGIRSPLTCRVMRRAAQAARVETTTGQRQCVSLRAQRVLRSLFVVALLVSGFSRISFAQTPPKQAVIETSAGT